MINDVGNCTKSEVNAIGGERKSSSVKKDKEEHKEDEAVLLQNANDNIQDILKFID